MPHFIAAAHGEAAGAAGMDRFSVIEKDNGMVLMVADGAGGISGGARAADMVVELLREVTYQDFEPDDIVSWITFFTRLDSDLLEDADAGETTAVIAFITPRGIYGASVGDSGAWMISPAKVKDLSREQKRKPLLGTGFAAPCPFQAGPLQGTLLLATDGLFKYASSKAIAAAAMEPDLNHAAERLVSLVRLPSGKLQDDVAVVLCRSSQ
jgi:serine/threonine protein phosphatase PrpC